MPLFVCATESCLTIENSALVVSYWRARIRRSVGAEHTPPVCSACESGAWHGKFERRQYDPERDGPMEPFTRKVGHVVGG